MPAPDHASLTLRWTRAVLLGSVALAAGAGAHVSAAGRLPGPVGLTALGLACVAGAALFLGREASALRLVVLVVAGQGFVHTGLSALAGHRGDHSGDSPGTSFAPVAATDRSGSYYDQWAQSNPAHMNPADHGEAGPVVPSWLLHGVADIVQQPGMAAMHVLAAVLVGLWLAVGERALWAVLALTAAWAVRVVARLTDALSGAVPVAPRIQPVRPTAYPVARAPRVNVRSRPVRRGPPVLLTAH